MTVSVRDSGNPPQKATLDFKVEVKEVNALPVIDAIPDQVIRAGEALKIQVKASDGDIPKQTLQFSLKREGSETELPSSPSESEPVIDPVTGEFRWSPGAGDVSEKPRKITVVVSDGSGEGGVKEASFQVQVKANGPVKPAQLRAVFTDGKFEMRVEGTVNQSYEIEASLDLVTWTVLGTVTTDGTGQAQFTDSSGSGYRFFRSVVR